MRHHSKPIRLPTGQVVSGTIGLRATKQQRRLGFGRPNNNRRSPIRSLGERATTQTKVKERMRITRAFGELCGGCHALAHRCSD
jgi:hypothetical protein